MFCMPFPATHVWLFCLSLRSGMFLFQAEQQFPPYLCISLRHRAPQTVLSLPFWLSHVRRLAALLIQLRCSFNLSDIFIFNIKLYVNRRERHHQIPSDSVHRAVQLYPVICHEEKKIHCSFVMLNKTV